MWSYIYKNVEEIRAEITKENPNWDLIENLINELNRKIQRDNVQPFDFLRTEYETYKASRNPKDLDDLLYSLDYIAKSSRLKEMFKDLDNISEKASKNNLYSPWHSQLLNNAKTLSYEVNALLTSHGRPAEEFDFSKYTFTPGEFTIDDLATSYEYYNDIKRDYENDILPKYNDIYAKYNNGEVSEEEYQKVADETIEYINLIKQTRSELMENILTASADDYQKVPKHEVDAYLEDLQKYNEKLKEYNKLYKEWDKLKTSNGDPKTIEAMYANLSSLAEVLQPQRPGLVKRRGLIYNTRTLNELKTQKRIIEGIIRDNTDLEFETVKERYVDKLNEINALIKGIEKFRDSLTVGRIKPLEPLEKMMPKGLEDAETKTFVLPAYSEGEGYDFQSEIRRLFGPDANETDYDITEISRDEQWVTYEAKKKARRQTSPKKPKEPGKEYDMRGIEEPGFNITNKPFEPIPPERAIEPYESKLPVPVPPQPVPPKPIPPKPPIPPQPEPPRKNYYNLEELISKILFGDPPDETIHYGKMDNFVYMNKDARIVNFPKSYGVTILDKPMKLVKTAISSVVMGIGKLAAKIGYRNGQIRENIDGLSERINQLSNEELEFLLENLTVNRMTELSKTIPEVAMSALNNRISVYYNQKLEVVNQGIYDCYQRIIKNYRSYELLEAISPEGLSPADAAEINRQKTNLDRELCNDIISLDERKKFASTLNKGGAMSFIENWNARHNGSAGGRNISRQHDDVAILPYGYTKIGTHLTEGRGYLAARDFLYGEKIKIAGTETAHRARNWFHRTRVGAYEFKPFVETVDYSPDTYLQDVFSTVAIVASVGNMLYVKNLQDQLANAQQQISSLNQTIASNNQQIQALQQQINQLNTQIAAQNQYIQINNQAISKIKNICNLYNGDPQAFVDKMVEFVQIENGKTHGFTEYAMQMGDAGRAGTLNLSSSGGYYSAFDAQGHLISGDNVNKIMNISNDATLNATQKAQRIGDVLRDMDKNLNTVVGSVKTDALNYLNLSGSSQWSLSAFANTMNTIATYDSTFVPNVFDAFVNVALESQNLAYISGLTGINITMQNLPTIAATIPTASLIPAIVALSSLVGKEATQSIIDQYRNQPQRERVDTRDLTEDLAEEINGVQMDVEDEAKRLYEERMDEWNQNGPFYRLRHRHERPSMYQAYADARRELEEGQGRGM